MMAPLNANREIPPYPGTNERMNPTDWLIVSVLGMGRRQSRNNMSRLLGKDTGYVSQRITEVLERGLIRRVGDGDRANLYEATPTGYAALRGAAEPTHDERTRPGGRLLHMTPQMYDIVRALYEEPLLATEVRRVLDSPDVFDKTLIDALEHYGLVERVSMSVKREYDDPSIETTESEEPGYVLTGIGETVVEHYDDWVAGGNPRLTDAVTKKD